jgi:hypothetical protein
VLRALCGAHALPSGTGLKQADLEQFFEHTTGLRLLPAAPGLRERDEHAIGRIGLAM